MTPTNDEVIAWLDNNYQSAKFNCALQSNEENSKLCGSVARLIELVKEATREPDSVRYLYALSDHGHASIFDDMDIASHLEKIDGKRSTITKIETRENRTVVYRSDEK